MSNDVTGHLDAPPIDYFEDMDQADVREDAMERLVRLADEAAALSVKQAEMAAALAEVEEAIISIKRVSIPELMLELGIASMDLEDGRKVSIKNKLRASIKEDDKAGAFAWLEETDNDGIIKTKVGAEFGRGEMDEARKVLDAIRAAGFDGTIDRSIHNATLCSFVKEQLENGVNLPKEFSVFEFKEADIKKPAARKGKK